MSYPIRPGTDHDSPRRRRRCHVFKNPLYPKPPSSPLNTMATLIRSPKPASKWTTNELEAFNITIEDADLEQFFGITQLPPVPATVPQALLNGGDKPEGQVDYKLPQFFQYPSIGRAFPRRKQSAIRRLHRVDSANVKIRQS